MAYTSSVRLTHRKSGSYREDCGAGDAIDKSLGTAVANALKASITDAMKRAARHFGDKLGNCKSSFLYITLLGKVECLVSIKKLNESVVL